jgi:hypothetical protein
MDVRPEEPWATHLRDKCAEPRFIHDPGCLKGEIVKNNCMPWFALLVICFALILSARIARELSVYSRMTPSLIFFYSSAGEDCSDVAPGFWRVIFIAAI